MLLVNYFFYIKLLVSRDLNLYKFMGGMNFRGFFVYLVYEFLRIRFLRVIFLYI